MEMYDIHNCLDDIAKRIEAVVKSSEARSLHYSEQRIPQHILDEEKAYRYGLESALAVVREHLDCGGVNMYNAHKGSDSVTTKKWWAYKHQNGRIFLRRLWEGESGVDEIDDARQSPFVSAVTEMFTADTHEEAQKTARHMLSYVK